MDDRKTFEEWATYRDSEDSWFRPDVYACPVAWFAAIFTDEVEGPYLSLLCDKKSSEKRRRCHECRLAEGNLMDYQSREINDAQEK